MCLCTLKHWPQCVSSARLCKNHLYNVTLVITTTDYSIYCLPALSTTKVPCSGQTRAVSGFCSWGGRGNAAAW